MRRDDVRDGRGHKVLFYAVVNGKIISASREYDEQGDISGIISRYTTM